MTNAAASPTPTSTTRPSAIAGFETVHAAFAATAARAAASPFVAVIPTVARAYGIATGEWSYGECRDRIERLRARYAQAGWGHGHRVGLLLENRPAFFLHWLALNALGVSVVPINADLRASELDYLVSHSGIGLAVALAERHADLAAAAQRTGSTLGLVAEADGEPGRLPALPSPPGPAPRPGDPALDTECALLYTSGTTGRPKGCVLTNAYFLICGERYRTLGGLCAIEPGDRLITPLPLVHMNAMACSTMAMLMTGGCLIQLDRFHPRSWWDDVRAADATILHYLGVMPAMLIGDPPSQADRAHRVRFGFGAGVDRRLHAPFEARFGFPLIEGWAMTETGMAGVIIAQREPRHVGTACFGRPEATVQVRLVDEAGADVPVGSPGELLVRSAGADPRHGFFAEYLKDPQATAAAWEGGWFHTGDVVQADADGYLYFIDRRKNVIRRSGENIAAVEVESVLRRHPAIREVAVAATPDAVRGDEVLACVVAHDSPADDACEAQARAIVAWALEQLAYYKVPGWVAFVDALPLTATQKIQRGELKTLAAALPGTARCVDTRSMKKRSA